MRRVEKIDDLVPIRTAIVSVMDKSKLEVLIPGLIAINPEIIIFTTGGTFNRIKEIVTPEQLEKNIREVSSYTGQQESEGGLVKTLHHKLFLGYLTETYCAAHQADLRREKALPIDLVVINLYPFEKTIAQEGVDPEDARMNIDVGGPSALWASAKNFHRVACLTNPNQYDDFLGRVTYNNGRTTLRERLALANEVWTLIAQYSRTVARYFMNNDYPEVRDCYQVENPSL